MNELVKLRQQIAEMEKQVAELQKKNRPAVGSVALPTDERVSGRTNASSSNRADFSCQRVKLVGKRQLDAALQHELTFADHVHQFDAGEDISGGPK